MDQRNPAVHAIADFTHRELADDEIDLVDLAVILVSHWRLMLVMFVLALAAGAGAAWLQDTKYQYSAVIALGQRADGQLLDSPEAVQAAINNVFLPAVAATEDIEMRQLAANFRVELPKSSNTVVLKVKAPKEKADSVGRFFSLIGAPIIADHNKRSELLVDALDKQVAGQEAALAGINQNIAELQAELSNVGQEARILLLDQLGRLQEGRRLAQLELAQLQAKIAHARLTRMSGDPQRSSSGVGTSPQLIIALSIVLGGMLAVFSAFFAEFAARVRTRLRASKARAES